MSLKRGKYGSKINEYGVKFTKAELNRLNKAVEQANRIIDLERSIRPDLKKSKVTKEESRFYEFRKLDVERFQSKRAFTSYLRQTEQIARGTFYRNVNIEYRKNYIKALYVNYGDEATPLANKIARMNLNEFSRLVENDNLPDLQYHYGDHTANNKDKVNSSLELINQALGVGKVGRPRKNA